MNYGPTNTISPYLPEEFQLPVDEKQYREFISERERRTASNVNIREIGQFELQELLSGQTWFTVSNNPKRSRSVFRKVIDFGALPNATTKSVAHNITMTSTGFFTKVIAVAKNPTAAAGTPKYFQIPYASPVLNDNIEIFCDDTNVYIKTGKNQTAVTQVYCVLEYIKF